MQVCRCSYQRKAFHIAVQHIISIMFRIFGVRTFKNTVWVNKTTLCTYRISYPSGTRLVTHRDRPIRLHRTVNVQLNGIHLQCRGAPSAWLAYGASLTKWTETVVIFIYVGFEVLTAVQKRSCIFWTRARWCSPLNIRRNMSLSFLLLCLCPLFEVHFNVHDVSAIVCAPVFRWKYYVGLHLIHRTQERYGTYIICYVFLPKYND
jgi:hypothetical protein